MKTRTRYLFYSLKQKLAKKFAIVIVKWTVNSIVYLKLFNLKKLTASFNKNI